MPFLLARLGPLVGTGAREVDARRERRVDPMAPELLALPDGVVLLLRGSAPPWTSGARVSIAPWRALVIPLRAHDGGPRWYAWETVEDDHATYLFRPRDDDARDRMLAWTQAPGARRGELLRDEALQAELGYVRRVMHRDGGGRPLGTWWPRLCRAVGIPSPPGAEG